MMSSDDQSDVEDILDEDMPLNAEIMMFGRMKVQEKSTSHSKIINFDDNSVKEIITSESMVQNDPEAVSSMNDEYE